jgi:hypothetical protein
MQCKKSQQRKPKEQHKTVIDTLVDPFNRKKLKFPFDGKKGEGKLTMIFFSASDRRRSNRVDFKLKGQDLTFLLERLNKHDIVFPAQTVVEKVLIGFKDPKRHEKIAHGK